MTQQASTGTDGPIGPGGDGGRSVVYLDYNATTPIDPRVVEAMLTYLGPRFGNPSSRHAFGPPARAALAEARAQLARLIGAPSPESLVFTGSGSEADALAVRGAVLAAVAAGLSSGRRPRVVTQRTEHPAVLHACRHLQHWHGVDLVELAVDETGLVRPSDLRAALADPDGATVPVLVSIMHANNETGTVQDVAELAQIAHAAGALFHTDAAQTVGKLPVDVGALGVDLLTVVGHKMYAPKGIGALYVRPGVALEPLVGGGGQEHGLRAGTENVAHAVALGTAARLAHDDLDAGEPDRLRDLRDRLHDGLAAALPGRVRLNGHPTRRLPHTLNISIDGVGDLGGGDAILATTPTVAASTGSACHSDRTDPSPVLTAMGQPPEHALGAIRLSLGRWTTPANIDTAAKALTAAVTDLLSTRPPA